MAREIDTVTSLLALFLAQKDGWILRPGCPLIADYYRGRSEFVDCDWWTLVSRVEADGEGAGVAERSAVEWPLSFFLLLLMLLLFILS